MPITLPREQKGKMDTKSLHRFNKKVSKGTTPESCWLWTGSVDKKGYGTFGWGTGWRYAHRVSYAHFNGDVEKGVCVLHKCDTANCVNPIHLFLGSVIDNNHDMIAKGRHATENAGFVNEADVRYIKKALSLGETGRNLAYKFSVSETTISEIKNGRTWKGVICQ